MDEPLDEGLHPLPFIGRHTIHQNPPRKPAGNRELSQVRRSYEQVCVADIAARDIAEQLPALFLVADDGIGDGWQERKRILLAIGNWLLAFSYKPRQSRLPWQANSQLLQACMFESYKSFP